MKFNAKKVRTIARALSRYSSDQGDEINSAEKDRLFALFAGQIAAAEREEIERQREAAYARDIKGA